MSINKFLKNRRKKHLLKKIAKLRLEASDLQDLANSSKKVIDEHTFRINLHEKYARRGDEYAQTYLSRYLSSHLDIIALQEKLYAHFNELYLLQKENISRLEVKLSSL